MTHESKLMEIHPPLIQHGDYIQAYKEIKPEGWRLGDPWLKVPDFVGQFVGMALDGGNGDGSYSVFVIIDENGHFSTVPIHLCQKIEKPKGKDDGNTPSTNNA